MSGILINKKASQFRTMCGLSDNEPIHLKALLLRLNVLTIYRPLSENLSGMSLRINDKSRFILVNSNHTLGRQHFTLAHELYHLYIQDNFVHNSCHTGLFDSRNREEYNADIFASCLLMPESAINSLIPDEELPENKIKVSTLLKLEQYFSVSHSSMLHRLHALRRISKSRMQELKDMPVRATAREYGYSTALYKSGNEGVVSGDFGQKAKELFDREKISEGHYIELMQQIGIDITIRDNEPEA